MAIPEDPSLIPVTTWQLSMVCNSRSRRSNHLTVFTGTRNIRGSQTYMQTKTHT
ncbi:hypothetical protein I79_009955 [Cricetulus griseus]|uniref:Uncharacterized protein n=1 Tax=Cricetulus griseus TaxID=10029 RepID=G3HH58_CRIGR|nr:hypothetical protein I79_009955 [Cricetulus griseus]